MISNFLGMQISEDKCLDHGNSKTVTVDFEPYFNKTKWTLEEVQAIN